MPLCARMGRVCSAPPPSKLVIALLCADFIYTYIIYILFYLGTTAVLFQENLCVTRTPLCVWSARPTRTAKCTLARTLPIAMFRAQPVWSAGQTSVRHFICTNVCNFFNSTISFFSVSKIKMVTTDCEKMGEGYTCDDDGNCILGEGTNSTINYHSISHSCQANTIKFGQQDFV